MGNVYPVFISYAREASAASAQALHAALPGQCYLDTSDIEAGERFPEHVVDALLKSRVVVVFATELYFQRRHCLWELRAALEPYETRLRDGRSLDGELDHLVVIIPEG